MGNIQTAEIRNVLICGAQGSGKTTLIERMLFLAGAIPSMGSVEAKTTIGDFEPEERLHLHTLSTKVMAMSREGRSICVIDSPGLSDFVGQTTCAMQAVESVIITIDATRGIEPATRKLFKLASDLGLPRLLVVTKIDHTEANLAGLIDRIHEIFGPECIPINLPVKNNTDVVDVFDHASGGPAGESPIMSIAEAHQHIFEQVVEMDEELTGEYFEKGDKVDREKLHRAMEAALNAGHLIPIAFCSAKTGAGVEDLEHVIAQQLPSPLEGHPPLPHTTGMGGDGGEYLPDAAAKDKGVLAVVWKIVHDPFQGKLAFIRMLQGSLHHKAELMHAQTRKPVRVNHLMMPFGKEMKEITDLVAGQIGVIPKVDELRIGSLLHADAGLHLSPVHLPLPGSLAGVAIELKNHTDESKFTSAVHKLTEEDPCFHMERSAATGQTVIRAAGEMHLRIILEKIKTRFHIDLDTKPMKVAYKETISGKAEGHCRHKKQSGGAGQFGEVYLRVEPLPLDDASGFVFMNDTVGGSIPRQFIPAVEKGIRQVLATGAFAGAPMTGIKVSVYDGKYHDVDSKEIAFVTAGRKAFIDAVLKARPTLLEPICRLTITGPSARMGDISAEVSSKRGRIEGTEIDGDQCIVTAMAPMAELASFGAELKSITAGAASYDMEFSHYERTPPNVQQQVMASFKPKADED